MTKNSGWDGPAWVGELADVLLAEAVRFELTNQISLIFQ
jgi:hypothetical protein